MDLNVLSYNLQWWKTQGGPDISKTINANGPFDLMGFQECDNVGQFLNSVGADQGLTYASKQGPQDIAIAWDTKKFSKVDEGSATVGHDGWGGRSMQWVRLSVTGTDKHIVFANTHGPVNQCKGNEDWSNTADNYINNIEGAMKDGDSMFFTGDFNCGTPDDLMAKLRAKFNDAAQASYFKPILYQPDHIFTLQEDDFASEWTAVCCAQPGNCAPTTMTGPDTTNNCIALPADHMLLKGKFSVPIDKAVASVV